MMGNPSVVQEGIERIKTLQYYAKQATTTEICRLPEDEFQELVSLAQSAVTDIEGQRFQDFFPARSITKYRDTYGRRLPGMRSVWDDGSRHPVVRYIDVDDPTLALEDQEQYIRLKLLPKFTWVILQALVAEREARKLADVDKRQANQISAKVSERVILEGCRL